MNSSGEFQNSSCRMTAGISRPGYFLDIPASLLRAPSFLRRFWAFMDRTERHTNYPNLFRSTSLIHYLLVIFHWNGCLYHIVYKNNGFGSKNWVYDDSEKTDVITQYLQSCYWCTLALTTIGDLPRYIYISLLLCIDSIICNTVISLSCVLNKHITSFKIAHTSILKFPCVTMS